MRHNHPIRPEHLALLPDIRLASERHDLDAAVLSALLEHETEGEADPCRATRCESNYRWFWPAGANLSDQERDWQRHSWGVGQVMGAVLRELGFTLPLPDILDLPVLQVEYAARYLRRMMRGAPSVLYALARYNAGTVGERTEKGMDYAHGVMAGVDRWRTALAKEV
jgi:hypothetical protein